MKYNALKNAMEARMIINTGTIIAKGYNEFTFKDQIDLLGRGFKPVDKKEEGLIDYMFSIAIENDTYDTYHVMLYSHYQNVSN